ncbi:HEAT repeat domain-containing protein [Paludisphaera rhizosphaerae]|uniref:HEAT repeat domain-containing protein n=1 Tax=Paludisphaera rhizosphaerae TaxID=2711216 RepID=UPI0013EDDF71|nr:HEAT repeat domain-containing protein [Paludisphaera rhizosphaerae]
MSATTDYTIPFRGDLKAIAGVGSAVALATRHPEARPTALFWVDQGDDRPRSHGEEFPGGVTAIADSDSVWIAGTDGHVYRAPLDGPPKAIGPKVGEAKALALLSDDRLGVLVGREVRVLARKDGKLAQTIELPEPGSTLASDPSGKWLAVGTTDGLVSIYEAESSADFAPGDSARLHEGEVTAILFERDDLRFFSAGADMKLLSTHARGKLEPEDKGRANNHSDRITAMIWGPEDRLLTGSLDGTVKSWPRVGGVKPTTQKEGVVRVLGMALVKRHGRDHLVVAGGDDTLRTFVIDAAGKPAGLMLRGCGAMDATRADLAGDDPRAREAAIRRLAEFDDAASLSLLAEQAVRDPDHGLRLLAVQSLGQSDHPKSPALLEGLFSHAEAAVRTAAFEGLRRQRGPADLRVLDLALKAEKPEIGKLAVEALGTLAGKDDQALTRLTTALSAKTPEVRQAALMALESAYPADSPEANLAALGTSHADVRRAALMRLFARKMLGDATVQSALRRRVEDADPEVRRVAFLLSLHTRPALLSALRSRDPELERQLADLEGGQDPSSAVAKPKKGRGEATTKAETPSDEELTPLLQASASSALETSLRGARGLAVLGDPRAFGLLLQLSREEDEKARVEACRAMAALDDARGAERLRSLLYDPSLAVRDAAFTALARLLEDEPLKAAEAGLNAPSENVRQRGLQLLVAEARKAPIKSLEDRPAAMLADALNDSFKTVRSEAFKAALNLKVGGGGAATLRYVMRSQHADVRREAMTEAMANAGEPGGWDAVFEFLNDPDPGLRSEAYEFASRKTKGLETLDAALGSRYPDLRKAAVDGLVKKHTAAAQKLLARALDDEEKNVRLAALEALVGADAQPVLRTAVENPHADVRVRAARALARHGDPAALKPLIALATALEPEEEERRKDWSSLAESALLGLGQLGDASALTALIPLIDSPHAPIRQGATRALAWLTPADRSAPLRDALRHHDAVVRDLSAFGLTLLGDASAGPLVFADSAKTLKPWERFAAAVALSGTAIGDGSLVAGLDDSDEKIRARILLLLLMMEWKAPREGSPLVLAALAGRDPRTRLVAAEALEAMAAGAGGLAEFIVKTINDRGGKLPWTIPAAVVDDLAELLVHAEPRLRARSAELLRALESDEQAAWDQTWATHAERFAAAIEALRKAAAKRRSTTDQAPPKSLRELALGAYVGLLRNQGGTQKAGDPATLRVRRSALGRIETLAKNDPTIASAARPVLVQVLGDPNAAIRIPAFECLPVLGMEPTTLAAEALATGHVDLGVKALEILAAGGSTAEGRRVLDEAMLTRRDDLAIEAAKLLIAREGTTPVATRALEGAHEPLRKAAVAWLADEAEKDEKARVSLRAALSSRHAPVREAAAMALAARKDASAFDALVALLKAAPDANAARRCIAALTTLGDPRTATAFLDRVENDPSETAPADELIRAVGGFGRPEVIDRLFALWDKDRKRGLPAYQALFTISGHHQRIEDPEDEAPDRRWEEKQLPRRDDVLARLLARLTAPGEKGAMALIPAARWSRSKEVDPVLAGLIGHPDEAIRRAAIEAIGWRLRKRSGDPAVLVKALASKDPVAQLLAAEGLARVGRPEGLSVLMASVELVPDLNLRRRAVLALGELADERAAEMLIKLASDDAHALNEAAAEAIGHLGKSKHAEAVERLLVRLADGSGGVAYQAIKGLRWLDTAQGWRVLRRRAGEDSAPHREIAIEQLAHNDDPATRDLLLKLIREDISNEEQAYAAARKLWGPDALEPDEALLQSVYPEGFEEYDEALKRGSERSSPSRIFAILPSCEDDDVRKALARALLTRKDVPTAEARDALDSLDPAVSGLAAHILGRSGEAAKGGAKSVETTLTRWWKAWVDRRKTSRTVGLGDDDAQALVECLGLVAWAAGRLGVGGETLAAMASLPEADRQAVEMRRSAVEALAASPARKLAVAALEEAVSTTGPETRALAAQIVTEDAPDKALPLAEKLLADRWAFDRVARGRSARLSNVLRQASRQSHYQGVALPYLVAQKDVEGLAAVAGDRSAAEGARLGAIEALAALATEPAEDVLRKIGLDEREEEDLRKAAWRGLRKSKRLRTPKPTKTPTPKVSG